MRSEGRCRVCGRELEAGPVESGAQYCSNACRLAACRSLGLEAAGRKKKTLRCRQCGAVFRSKRKYRFCSKRCRVAFTNARKAAERRAEREALEALGPPGRSSFPRGSAWGRATRVTRTEGFLHCHICGRPLRAGEDFGQWRLQAFRESQSYLHTIHTICPLHYRPGEWHPRRPGRWQERGRKEAKEG